MTPLLLAAALVDTLAFTVPVFDSPPGCAPDSSWPRMAPVSVQIEARGPRTRWTDSLAVMLASRASWSRNWPTVAAEAVPRIARTKHYLARQPHEPGVRDTVRVEGATFRARMVKANGLASCWSRSVSP